MKLLIGGDPEIFLWDPEKKQHVSAHDLVPGTKKKPHKLDKGSVQADGTAMEIGIDPTDDEKTFISNIDTVLEQCREIVPKHLEFKYVPAIEYPLEYYEALPKLTKEMGCEPDFNMKGTTNPVPRARGTLRTGGGHIHLGWNKGLDVTDRQHFYDCRMMTERLSTYFGMYIPLWDPDQRRQTLYGAAGSFRPKPYGVEYREPSNAWLAHRELWPWLFQSTQWIFDHALSKRPFMRTYYPGDFHYRNYLGRDKNGAEIFDTPYYFEYKLHMAVKETDQITKRLARLNEGMVRSFGSDTFPKFPENFKQVPLPPIELASDEGWENDDYYDEGFED